MGVAGGTLAARVDAGEPGMDEPVGEGEEATDTPDSPDALAEAGIPSAASSSARRASPIA